MVVPETVVGVCDVQTTRLLASQVTYTLKHGVLLVDDLRQHSPCRLEGVMAEAVGELQICRQSYFDTYFAHLMNLTMLNTFMEWVAEFFST